MLDMPQLISLSNSMNAYARNCWDIRYKKKLAHRFMVHLNAINLRRWTIAAKMEIIRHPKAHNMLIKFHAAAFTLSWIETTEQIDVLDTRVDAI